MVGAAILRVLQDLSSLTSINTVSEMDINNGADQHDDQATIWNLNTTLEPLWQ